MPPTGASFRAFVRLTFARRVGFRDIGSMVIRQGSLVATARTARRALRATATKRILGAIVATTVTAGLTLLPRHKHHTITLPRRGWCQYVASKLAFELFMQVKGLHRR